MVGTISESRTMKKTESNRTVQIGLVFSLSITSLVIACSQTPANLLSEAIRIRATELVSEAEEQDTFSIIGRDGWFFFVPELRHLSASLYWGKRAESVSRARDRNSVDPLPAILDFKQQLELLEVELLLVPVPLKSVIYPDQLQGELKLPSTIPRLDEADASFYQILRNNGIKVLDLTETFLQSRSHPEGPVYCRTDTHWSGVGCVIAAEQISRVVQDKLWFTSGETKSISTSWYTDSIQGDLAPVGSHEELRLRKVERDTRKLQDEAESQIVLLGDSHNLVFHLGDDMHATDAGLADQLAAELGVTVDVIAVRGSGATAARINLLRRAQRIPNYWKNKKLVIWCFSAREFTQSDGWSLVPIAP